MSIDREFERRGIELTEDNSLPVGQRTQKNVKRVIAAVRAAEAGFNDEMRAINEKLRNSQDQTIALQHENQRLRQELEKRLLKERLESIDTLSTAERKLLLEGPMDQGNQEAA